MIQVDLRSRQPLYEQLYENIRKLILDGDLSQDEQLPSVRELASDLAINPNTIQKAFRQLERDGYVYAVRGKGNFVDVIKKDIREREQKAALARLSIAVEEAKRLDISVEEIEEEVRRHYSEEGQS